MRALSDSRSEFRPARSPARSLFFSARRFRDSSAVLKRTSTSCSRARTESISSEAFRSSSCAFFNSSSICSARRVILSRFPASSSISRFRPRRFELFRNAPPEIAPPGFRSSPSRVTIRSVYRYFCSILTARSISVTTRSRPRRFCMRPLYCASVRIRSAAQPITPSSSSAGLSPLVPALPALESGRKVALP